MIGVLVVDDDPVIRRLLEVNFRLDDFEVRSAGSGEQALALMDAARPDAVVLDITMPDMDGFDVARRMREAPALFDVPILMLSARSRDEDRAEAERLGAVAFLTKPFDPNELIHVIRDAVAGAA